MSRAPLRYHQPLHPAVRVILAICAAIPLWGFYDLLIAPGMPWLQWGMAPFLVMGLIALCFGSLFLGVAIFGGARTVTIDRRVKACIVDFEGTFGLHRRFSHPFSLLGEPHAVDLPDSDGPGHWAVQFSRQNVKQPIIVETFPEEARARAEAHAIAEYIAGR